MIRFHFSALKTSCVCAAAVLLLSFGFALAEPLKLTVVLSEEGGAYLEYSNALAALLADKNVTLNVINAEKPLPASGLVVAAGMKASLSVARAKPAAMLAVLVPKEGFNKLLKEFTPQAKSSANALSAIYLDQPFKRQLDLITAVLPHARSIGVLYSTAPAELNKLRALAGARKLEFHERSSVSSSSLYSNLQSLLLDSDVLLALPDAEIYNPSTIRNILLATYRNKVPLVGFSSAYVKAGALCAVFSTPAQIARQSLSIIQEYTETGILPAAQFAKDFEVSINEQVAHSLGLNIRSVSQLRSEIGVVP